MSETDEGVHAAEFAEAEAAEEKQEPKQWVVWDHRWDFESRGLTRADLLGLGAEEEEGERLTGLEWNAANGHKIARDAIPLNDLELGALLGTDKSFRLVER